MRTGFSRVWILVPVPVPAGKPVQNPRVYPYPWWSLLVEHLYYQSSSRRSGCFHGRITYYGGCFPNYQSKDPNTVAPQAHLHGLAAFIFDPNTTALNVMGDHTHQATISALTLYSSSPGDVELIHTISAIATGEMLWMEFESQDLFVSRCPHVGQGQYAHSLAPIMDGWDITGSLFYCGINQKG